MRSLSPKEQGIRRPWLLISDGSEFAFDLYDLASIQVDIEAVTIPRLDSVFAEADLLANRPVAIVVRGEHFQDGDADVFYRRLRDFVWGGGTALATPWVSWESHPSGMLKDILPFAHPTREFSENLLLECQVMSSIEISGRFAITASHEHLESKPGSEVLVQTRAGIPILGYRRAGLGRCYYLNVCQHSCNQETESPLREGKEFRDVIKSLFLDLSSRTANSHRPKLLHSSHRGDLYSAFVRHGHVRRHFFSAEHNLQFADVFRAPDKTEKRTEDSEKAARKSPCPCGSGKEYENCCGQ